jgi:hypothetical protein
MTTVIDRPSAAEPPTGGPRENPRTLRTILLVAGSIVVAAIIGYLVLGAVMMLTRSDQSGEVAVSERFDTVSVESNVTAVTVDFADVDEAQVVFDQDDSPRNVDFDVKVVGSTLEVSVKDRWEWLFPFDLGHDSSQLDITLPRSMDDLDLQLDSNVGNSEVSGDFASVTYDGHVGDLDISGTAGEAILESDVGSIRADDFSVEGALHVSSSVGDAVLDLAKVPSDLTVDTSVGSQRVTLPEGEYYIDAASQVGAARVSAPSDRSASSVLRFTSSVGDITVEERD